MKGALRFWDYNEKQGLSFKEIQSVHFRQCVKQPGRAELELRVTIRNKVIFTLKIQSVHFRQYAKVCILDSVPKCAFKTVCQSVPTARESSLGES